MFKRQYLPTSEQAAAVVYQLIIECLEHIHIDGGKVKLLQFRKMLECFIKIPALSERDITLIPFLSKLNDLELFVLKNIICDAGYESEENYLYLSSHNMTSYIKPVNYEQSKKRNYRTKYGRPENMEYHELDDIFVCRAGRILWHIGTKHEKTKTGFVSEEALYRCESCEGCPYKQNCTKAKGNKTPAISHKFKELRAESPENITTEFGRQLRMNRSIQAEGVFGVLKQDHGFRRFLCRGKNNIRTEFLLLGLAYNINKLFAKISENRLGISLFELKTA